MPLYEYRCTACRKRVTVLTLRVSEDVRPTCDHCGSAALERLMSRFAMVRSEDARLESLSDPTQLGDLDERDPKSMARWMKRMGRELGDELGGGELDEMVEEMETAADKSDDDAGGTGDPGGDDVE
ncbi:MAG: FmdB family zinc ribbon protein [Candidatus Binatia bacterium]